MAPRADQEVPVDAGVLDGPDTPPVTAPGDPPGSSSAASEATGAWSTRASKRGLLVVTIVPFLANLPAIIGLVMYQPILLTSGLGVITKKGFIPGQPFIDPNVGYNSQAVGHAAAMAWLHGHVPWWNLNGGLGMPLAASVQSASFLPLTLLQALSQGSMWFHLSLEVVAGIATYALLRQLRCSPFAATMGAIAFQLNGSIAWVTNAPANPVPFLPLCLLGVEYVVNAAGAKRKGGWILLAVGVWLSVVAGFPEVAVINAGLVACWFLVRLIQRWPDRTGILVRGAIGVAVGFCLGAPVLNAFVQLLKVANVGIHKFPLATFTIPRAGLAQLVTPYFFGGILDTPDPTVYEVWTRTGGYAGATLLVLALGAMWGRRERWLRVLLGGWALLFIGSNFNVPVLHPIVANLPGLTHLAVYRYDMSSALLCLCLLAAFCIDDLIGLSAVKVLQRILPGIVLVLVLFVIGFFSAPGGRAWAHLHEPTWYWGSIAIFVATLGGLVVALVFALVNRRSLVRIVIGAVLVVEAFGYFEVPMLAWPRSATVDTAPVSYLRAHLGVQRYFSTGPAAPNYAAYYGIATLGASDLPIPKNWGIYVNEHLSPCILPWQLGNGGPIAGCPITPVLAAMKYVVGYEESGVKYLLVGHRTHLALFMQPQIAGVGTVDGGVKVAINFQPPAYFHTGVLTSVAVDLPGGPPPGVTATVCSGPTCVTATPTGEGTGGEQFALAAPLELGSALSITLVGSNEFPVKVVTVPAAAGIPSSVIADGVALGGLQAPRQARVRFTYEPDSIPRLVFQSATSHVYLLPHPSPIATAPGCSVAAGSMTSFTVRCSHASTLTYRELSYKGWHASVAGHGVTLTTDPANGVFQELPVPAGTSLVTFSYAPPHSELAFLAVLVGLLAIVGSVVRRRFGWTPWELVRPGVRAAGPPEPTEPGPSVPGPSEPSALATGTDGIASTGAGPPSAPGATVDARP